MHAAGENNERRAPFAMQKKLTKTICLPIAYQGINHARGPYNLAQASTTTAPISQQAVNTWVAFVRSNGANVQNVKVAGSKLTMTLGYVSITLTVLELEQLRQNLNNSPKLQENLTEYLMARYGQMLPNSPVIKDILNNLDIVAAKLKFALNSSEYAKIKQQLDSLGPSIRTAQQNANTTALNSLQANLKAINSSIKITGKSWSEIQQGIQADIAKTRQAINTGSQHIKAFISDVNKQIAAVKNQIEETKQAYNDAKPERDAIAAVAALTTELTRKGYYIKDKGSKAQIDGQPMIRFSTGVLKTTTGQDLTEDQVFGIPVNEAAKLANIPFDILIKSLNKYLRKHANSPIKAFGEVSVEAVRSEQTGTTGPVAVSPEQNAALRQYNEMTFNFTSAVRGLLYNSNTSYAVTGDTTYGIYNNQYVQLLSVNGQYHFAIPLTDIYNNKDNFDAFLSKGLRSYLLPGRPSEKIKLIEDLIQGVKIAQKPVESTPLGGDLNPGDSSSYIKPKPSETGAGGVPKPGPIKPNNPTTPGAQRPSASAGGTRPANSAENSSASLLEFSAEEVPDQKLRDIYNDTVKEINKQTFKSASAKISAFLTMLDQKIGQNIPNELNLEMPNFKILGVKLGVSDTLVRKAFQSLEISNFGQRGKKIFTHASRFDQNSQFSPDEINNGTVRSLINGAINDPAVTAETLTMKKIEAFFTALNRKIGEQVPDNTILQLPTIISISKKMKFQEKFFVEVLKKMKDANLLPNFGYRGRALYTYSHTFDAVNLPQFTQEDIADERLRQAFNEALSLSKFNTVAPGKTEKVGAKLLKFFGALDAKIGQLIPRGEHIRFLNQTQLADKFKVAQKTVTETLDQLKPVNFGIRGASFITYVDTYENDNILNFTAEEVPNSQLRAALEEATNDSQFRGSKRMVDKAKAFFVALEQAVYKNLQAGTWVRLPSFSQLSDKLKIDESTLLKTFKSLDPSTIEWRGRRYYAYLERPPMQDFVSLNTYAQTQEMVTYGDVSFQMYQHPKKDYLKYLAVPDRNTLAFKPLQSSEEVDSLNHILVNHTNLQGTPPDPSKGMFTARKVSDVIDMLYQANLNQSRSGVETSRKTDRSNRTVVEITMSNLVGTYQDFNTGERVRTNKIRIVYDLNGFVHTAFPIK
jgi:DNA-binding transcriptional regulator YhcF (GntR family)